MKLTANEETKLAATLAKVGNAQLQEDIEALEYAKKVAVRQGADVTDLDYHIELRRKALK
jgi:hypothetical protein